MKTTIVLTFGVHAAFVAAIIGFFASGPVVALVAAVAAIALYVVIAKVAVG
jgi:hypothetical protein